MLNQHPANNSYLWIVKEVKCGKNKLNFILLISNIRDAQENWNANSVLDLKKII